MSRGYEESCEYKKRIDGLFEFCEHMDTSVFATYNLVLLTEKLNEHPYRKSEIKYKDLKRVLNKFNEVYRSSRT